MLLPAGRGCRCPRGSSAPGGLAQLFLSFGPPCRACSGKGWFGSKRPGEAVLEGHAAATGSLKRRKSSVHSDVALNVEGQLVEGS